MVKTPTLRQEPHGIVGDVLGLDVSLTSTGASWADRLESITYPRNRQGDSRLLSLWDYVMGVIDSATIETEMVRFAVIEDLPTHAMAAGKTGMAQGVVRHALMCRSIPYVLIPPSSLKAYATGGGGADKPEMARAYYLYTGKTCQDNDAVDAWWLRQAGLEILGRRSVAVPEAQRKRVNETWSWGWRG